MNKKEQLLLLVIALVQFTNIMDFMIMMPLGPQFMRTFNITPAQFSLLVSSYTISAGIVGFICSFFLDRFDRKKFLMVTYAGFAIGTLACALSSGYHILLAARIITGVFGGILGAQVLAIVGDSFEYSRRAFAMSFVSAAFSFASVFGVPFGLYMAVTFSWHMPFVVIFGFAVVVLFLIYKFVPELKSHLHDRSHHKTGAAVFSLFKDANLLMALLFMMLLVLGQFTIAPFIAPYMVYNVGFTEHQLTFIYLFGGAASIITSPVVGKIADKKGKLQVFIIAAALAIIPLYLITNMMRGSISYALIITTLFFVFISGRMSIAMTMITGTIDLKRRGSFMSINSSVQMLSAGIASLISGAIVTQLPSKELVHYSYIGYIAIISSLLAILVATRLKTESNVDVLK
ncbi:MAG: MFS transporter [Chitinophagales bacterium]|nr:MFS transporter [Chitinophagales bacterium]